MSPKSTPSLSLSSLLAPIVFFALAYLFGGCCAISSILLYIAGGIHLCHTVYRSLKLNVKGRAVLVTGCDTGFGHQVAMDLHDLEFIVFAGCLEEQSDGARKLRSLGKETGRLHVIKMDVTNEQQVEDARRYIQNHLPESGLWGIINNAGLGNVGFVEWTSLENFRKQAEVNLFGAIRVTKSFMSMIRQSQGRIVNVSSIMARISSPYSSAYCVTKHGIAVFTDCLRMEMKRFNVTVCTIEPGNYLAATKLAGKDGPYLPVQQLWDEQPAAIQKAYGKEESLDKGIYYSIDVYMKLARTDVSPVVNAMVAALTRRFPKDRYFEASIPDLAVTYFYQFAPTFLSDRLIMLLSQK